MKAPDKIYVASYNGEAFSHSWTIEPLGDTTATEYIRKDAVLELLQNRNKEINGTSKTLFRSQELQEIYWRIKEL